MKMKIMFSPSLYSFIVSLPTKTGELCSSDSIRSCYGNAFEKSLENLIRIPVDIFVKMNSIHSESPGLN